MESETTAGPLSMNSRPSDPLLSLVVPVFNEEAAVASFLVAVHAALPASRHRLEIVFVNDGSRDDTLAVLTAAATTDTRLVVVNLSRNFGKEAALTAGLEHATGDIVVPIDVDLQDPPDVIPLMLQKWSEGYDVVVAARTARRYDGMVKRTTASWFYRVFNLISSTPMPSDAGDFRLMDRQAVDALLRLGERNRFMKGLFAWTGFLTATVEYARPERAIGKTKWNYWKLWNFALDGIFSFSTVPLRVWTYLGILVAMLAASYAGFIFVQTVVRGVDVPGYASIMVAVLTLGAIQLVSIGIIGEYVGRLFMETKQRPLYIVRGVYSAEAGRRRGVAAPTSIAVAQSSIKVMAGSA